MNDPIQTLHSASAFLNLKLALLAERLCGRLPPPIAASQTEGGVLSGQDSLHGGTSPHAGGADGPGAGPKAQPLVFLVEDDRESAALLAQRMSHAGYAVSVFHKLDDFVRACAGPLQPQAIVMDIVFPESNDAGIQSLVAVRAKWNATVPVVFTSTRDDIEARLGALRAGGSRYLTKPVDTERLLAILDDLTGRNLPEPYRVLLVDGDESALRDNASVLRQAGMVVHGQARPLAVLSEVRAFAPDAIVLELHMPEVTGLELAALLREDEKLAQTPILFLSAESGAQQQPAGLDLGGDYFLAKPVPPARLVAAVRARAKRARHLQSVTDSLKRALRDKDYQHLALDQHAIVSVADPAGLITYANPKFCQISGYSLPELIGQNHRIVKSSSHPPEFFQAMWATIASGKTWQGRICNRRKDGRLYWVESTIVPFLDAGGRPYQYVSVRTDVTPLMEMEAQLRQSEERLRRSQVYANIGTWDWNIQTGELYWSERIGPLFGYEELVETTYENFLKAVHPDDRQTVVDAVDACVMHGAKYDIEHRTVWPDGSVRWLLERGDVVRADDGTPLHMLGVVQDITKRKQAEDALRESEANLSMAQRVAHLGSFDWNLQTGELRWSDEHYRLWGLEPRSVQPGYAVFRDGLHADDVADVEARIKRALKGEQPYECIHRVRWLDGSERYIYGRGEVFRAADGSAQRMIGTVLDVTERIHAERALVQAKEEAERANRAKSEFLSRMSHELRTPMNAILGFAQLLDMDDSLSADQQESVKEITGAGRHLLELINEVLDLARIEAGRIGLSIEPVEYDELAGECLSLIKPLADKRGIALNGGGKAGIQVRADRIRLKQILLNLLSNAVKYNFPQGSVRLYSQIREPGRVRIVVADSGPGIPGPHLSELFQPFHRLGAEATEVEGTGIGLAISRHLAEMMGGTLDVESRPGQGSSFWIELPGEPAGTADVTIESEGCAPVAVPTPAASTVLYVEDNPTNVRLVSQVLAQRPQVRLVTAPTPSLGLELAAGHRPDLILLDINLPGMNGYQVLAALRADPVTAGIPVIAITANAMPQDIERGLAAGFRDYLTKPLDIPRFIATLDCILAESGDAGA